MVVSGQNSQQPGQHGTAPPTYKDGNWSPLFIPERDTWCARWTCPRSLSPGALGQESRPPQGRQECTCQTRFLKRLPLNRKNGHSDISWGFLPAATGLLSKQLLAHPFPVWPRFSWKGNGSGGKFAQKLGPRGLFQKGHPIGPARGPVRFPGVFFFSLTQSFKGIDQLIAIKIHTRESRCRGTLASVSGRLLRTH